MGKNNLKSSVITYSEYKSALEVVNRYKLQLEEQLYDVKKEVSNNLVFSDYGPDTEFFYVDCSVRLRNLIFEHGDKLGLCIDGDIKMKDFSGLSINEFSKCRNVGVKAIRELIELCHYSGVQLSK